MKTIFLVNPLQWNLIWSILGWNYSLDFMLLGQLEVCLSWFNLMYFLLKNCATGVEIEQVMRDHNIIADGWAGASNSHSHPTPNPSYKHTKSIYNAHFPTFGLVSKDWRLNQCTTRPMDQRTDKISYRDTMLTHFIPKHLHSYCWSYNFFWLNTDTNFSASLKKIKWRKKQRNQKNRVTISCKKNLLKKVCQQM